MFDINYAKIYNNFKILLKIYNFNQINIKF